jgi:NTP pyrophosphatase (non-canonical NTP hydrolase)
MNFKEYQAAAQEVATYPGKGESIIYPALGINGEAWELTDKIEDMPFSLEYNLEEMEPIFLETGDCLWYIQDIAFETDIDLSYWWNLLRIDYTFIETSPKLAWELVSEMNMIAGAVAEMAKKQFRDKKKLDKENLQEALETLLWLLAEIINHYSNGTKTLVDIGAMNLKKLKHRKETDTINGSGDYR